LNINVAKQQTKSLHIEINNLFICSQDGFGGKFQYQRCEVADKELAANELQIVC